MKALDGIIEYGTASERWACDQSLATAPMPMTQLANALSSGADFAIFWKVLGDRFVVGGDFVQPHRVARLRALRGDDKTFVTESRGFQLPVDGESMVSQAFHQGKEVKLQSAGDEKASGFKRADLAKEFNVDVVCCAPCAGGVLEYGMGKSKVCQSVVEQKLKTENTRGAVLADICSNSKFVYAQVWLLADSKDALVYLGEHYTTSSFAQRARAQPKYRDALDQFHNTSMAETPRVKLQEKRAATTRSAPTSPAQAGGLFRSGTGMSPLSPAQAGGLFRSGTGMSALSNQSGSAKSDNLDSTVHTGDPSAHGGHSTSAIDATSFEAAALEQRSEVVTQLDDYLLISPDARLHLGAQLFDTCVALPLVTGRGKEGMRGVLLLFTPNPAVTGEDEEPLPMGYLQRSGNAKLFALLDRGAKMIACTMALDRSFPQYKNSFGAKRVEIQARVRRFWFKLRLVVRCGWVKSGKDGKRGESWFDSAKMWLKAYLQKWKGAGVNSPPRVTDWPTLLLTFSACMLGLGICSLIHFYVFLPERDNGWQYNLISGSFGALACLLYAMPQAPFSQPKMILLGHVLALSISISLDYFSNTRFATAFVPNWIMVTISPALVIAAMALCGVINPPAAAASLVYASGSTKIKDMYWLFIFFPNLIGCLVLIGTNTRTRTRTRTRTCGRLRAHA